MKRICAGLFVAILTLGTSLGAFPTAASAAPTQDGSNACFPGSDPDYPPTGDGVSIIASLRLESGQFNPGGVGVVVLIGASANAVLCGTAFSTPISLPAKQADANGRVVYNFAVPSDFELNAEHHIDVFQLQQRVGAFDFCVNKTGAITALGTCGGKAAKGPIAKTGTDNAFEIARAGVVFLGVGATALYLRRRKVRSAA